MTALALWQAASPQLSKRSILISSYRAARMRLDREHGMIVNAATRAGQLLLEHGDVAKALALETIADDFGLLVRTYLREVLLEERASLNNSKERE